MKIISVSITERHIEAMKIEKTRLEIGSSDMLRRILDLWMENKFNQGAPDNLVKRSPGRPPKEKEKVNRYKTLEEREIGEVWLDDKKNEVYKSDEGKEVYTAKGNASQNKKLDNDSAEDDNLLKEKLEEFGISKKEIR